jgi:hypothetical protein
MLQVALMLQHNATESTFYHMGTWRKRTHTWLAGVAQAELRLGWPGGGEIFRTSPDRPWGLPTLQYRG